MSGATKVTLAELTANAPHRITRRELNHHMLPTGEIQAEHRVYFDDIIYVDKRVGKAKPTPSLQAFISRTMMTGIAPNRSGTPEIVPFELPQRARSFVRAYQAALDIDNRSHVVKTLLRENILDRIINITLASVPEGTLAIDKMDQYIPKVNMHDFIRPSRSKRIKTIRDQAHDSMTVGDQEVSVLYRNGKAYISVPHIVKHLIDEDTFTPLGADRHIWVKSGSSRHLKLSDYLVKVQTELKRTKEKTEKEETRLAQYTIPTSSPNREQPNKGNTGRRKGRTSTKKDAPRAIVEKPSKPKKERRAPRLGRPVTA